MIFKNLIPDIRRNKLFKRYPDETMVLIKEVYFFLDKENRFVTYIGRYSLEY